MTKVATTAVSVVDGVEVDIEVRGDGDRAEKVLMDLKDRLGWLGAAYELEKAPSEITDRPHDKTPPMTIDWEMVFEDADVDS